MIAKHRMKHTLRTAAVILLCFFSLFGATVDEPVLAQAADKPQYQVDPQSIQGGITGDSMKSPLYPSYQVKSWNGLEAALPSKFDWRNLGNVTPVGDQGNCGSGYAFAGIGDLESKLIEGGQGSFDLSENNIIDCNFYTRADNYNYGGCVGGNEEMVAGVLLSYGSELESCDPYVSYAGGHGSCNTSCAHQYTVKGLSLISGDTVPDTTVLKNYLMTYGPLYTTMFANFKDFFTCNGRNPLYYPYTGDVDHAVLIVGWDDSLSYPMGNHTTGHGAWIVKNSFGTGWGRDGYFKIAYGSAAIGKYTSYISNWEKYDTYSKLYNSDMDNWTGSIGFPHSTTPLVGWGLNIFRLENDYDIQYATDIDFWSSDSGSVSVYLYEGFDGNSLGKLIAEKINIPITEAGLHSVSFDKPIPLGNLYELNYYEVMVRFENTQYSYPLPFSSLSNLSSSASINDYSPDNSYISPDGTDGSWKMMDNGYLTIALRTSTNPYHKATQAITITTAPPDTTPFNTSFRVAAVSSSGLPVQITGEEGECKASGSIISVSTIDGNSCVVVFSQPGNDQYLPAPVIEIPVTVTPGKMLFHFDDPPPIYALWGTQFTVAAKSEDGSPVTYSSGDPTICTNDGGVFTVKSGITGICPVQVSDVSFNKLYFIDTTQFTVPVLVTQTVPPQMFLPKIEQ